MDKMRLQKYLAEAGIASRRKSEELIIQGKVSVNGNVVTELGTQVIPNVDIVKYEGKEVIITVRYVSGVISSSYNKLNKAKVYVYAGKGTSGTKVLSSSDSISNNYYVLNDSYIDNNVYFDRLDAGEYTYVIQATYSNYYAKTTKELGVYNNTRTLKKVYFTVTP